MRLHYKVNFNYSIFVRNSKLLFTVEKGFSHKV